VIRTGNKFDFLFLPFQLTKYLNHPKLQLTEKEMFLKPGAILQDLN